jgi:hypothetical protein
LNKFYLFALFTLWCPWISAQVFDFFPEDDYKRFPNHLQFGMGASNFLGDLGGKNGIGTNDLQDLEISEFQYAAFIGYRHAFLKHLYGRADFAYGRVAGNDKLTKEPFRNNRNLNFRSNIFEADFTAEVWILLHGKKGHQYKLKRVDAEASPWHVRGAYLTFFGGLGVFHFNPKTNLNGEWIALRPLHTEGQGLPGGPKEYSLWQMNIPVGMSLMFRMQKQWSFGIELSYRYTFTDYIDDVSTSYYNPQDIALYSPPGMADVAAYLSNPSKGSANGGLPNYVTAPGQQRGDHRDKDGYMYLMIKCDHWIVGNKNFRKHKAVGKGGVRRSFGHPHRGAL